MKIDYYSGCKGLGPEYGKVIDEYIKGYYYNRSTGQKVAIPEGKNKYNERFICNIEGLNRKFHELYVTFHMAARLISKHSVTCLSDIDDLWRLVEAQRQTISFNNLFLFTLRKYQITEKKIYKAIDKDIDTQEDRIKRNKKMLERMLTDYGMQTILTDIEEDTGLDLFVHCTKFRDDALKDSETIAEKDKKREYERIENEYIEYLEKLAKSKGWNLYGSIDSSVVLRIEKNKAIHEEIIADNKRRKEKALLDKQISLLNRDNIDIQHDIDMLYSIINGGEAGRRLDRTTAIKLNTRFKGVSGELYYIAVIKGTDIKYLGKGGLSKSIASARMFRTKQSTQKCLNEAKSELGVIGEESGGFYAEVMKLIVLEHSDFVPSVKIANYIEEILKTSDSTYCEKILCKRIVDGAFGLDSSLSSGNAYIYVCNDLGLGKKLLCTNSSGKFIPGFTDDSVVVRPVMSKYKKDIGIDIDGKKAVFKCTQLNFTCNVCEHKLGILFNNNKNIHLVLHEDVELKHVHPRFADESSYLDFKQKVDKLLNSGHTKIFYVAGISMYTFDSIIYYNESDDTKYTKLLGQTSLFTCYEDAVESCNMLNNNGYTERYIWRIFRIQ